MKANTKQLSEAAGVDQRTVREFKEKGQLVADESGRYFDLDNTLNKSWCIRHGINPRDCMPNNIEKDESGQYDLNDNTISEITGVPETMLNMSLRELVQNFGDPKELKNLVDIYYKLMQSHKYDVDTQIKRSQLLPIEAFESLQSFNQRLIKQLMDYAEAAPNDFIPIIKQNEENAKIEIPIKMKATFEKLINDTRKKITSEIKKIKQQSKNKTGEQNDNARSTTEI